MRTFLTAAAMVSLGAGLWLYVTPEGGAAQSSRPTAVDPVRTFEERIERYVGVRTRLEQPLPSLDDGRRTAWSALLIRRYIASAVRAARPQARFGDIFGSPVGEMFRQTIGSAIGESALEGLVDEGETLVDLVVFEPVPGWALRPVPTPLLAGLPHMPTGVEYRVVGDSLILWDTHADIVIDALPAAFSGE